MRGALKIFDILGGWAKILAIFKNSIQPHFQPLSTPIFYPKFTFFTEKSLPHYIAGKTVSAPPPRSPVHLPTPLDIREKVKKDILQSFIFYS